MELAFFEGLVYAQKTLGTINSISADNYVKEYVGKPDMQRKSFRTYRNALVKKGWVLNNREAYTLPKGFDLHGRAFKSSGVLATFELVRNASLDRQYP